MLVFYLAFVEVYVHQRIEFCHHDVDVVAAYACRDAADALALVGARDGVELAALYFALYGVEVARNHGDSVLIANEDYLVSNLSRTQMQMEYTSICIYR